MTRNVVKKKFFGLEFDMVACPVEVVVVVVVVVLSSGGGAEGRQRKKMSKKLMVDEP
jgi:hypothetical protein